MPPPVPTVPLNTDAPPIKKNPADDLVYGLDFGNMPELSGPNPSDTMLGGGTPLVTQLNPPDANLSVYGTAQYNAAPGNTQLTQIIVAIKGGTNGLTYILEFLAIYASGRKRKLTMPMVVSDGSNSS